MVDDFKSKLLMCLNIEGNGDERKDGSSWVLKASTNAICRAVGQSQLELIRRASPKGKNKGPRCGTVGSGESGSVGVKEASGEESRDSM